MSFARWFSVTIGLFLCLATPSRAGEFKNFGFLAFGDSGFGNQNQKEVARAMGDFCKTNACDLVTLLGDNIYPDGVDSASDPQWEQKFEAPYQHLNFPFYPIFGNHDYHGNVKAQLEYSEINPKWKFPARYYSIEKEGTSFFMIDTEKFDEEQMKWLDEKVSQSSSRWKIVCGHRPIYSHGGHGNNASLKEKLLPIIKNRVDFYFSGHDHHLELIKKDFFPHFVISGAAADHRPVSPGKSTIYASAELGFTHVLVNEKEITIQFVSKNSKQIFHTKIEKN